MKCENGSELTQDACAVLRCLCPDNRPRRATLHGALAEQGIPAYVQVCHEGKPYTVTGHVLFGQTPLGVGYYFVSNTASKHYVHLPNK